MEEVASVHGCVPFRLPFFHLGLPAGLSMARVAGDWSFFL